jgi:hypothetical protein
MRITSGNGTDRHDGSTGRAVGMGAGGGSGGGESRFSGVVDRRSGLDRRLIEKMKKGLEGAGDEAADAARDEDAGTGTGLERRRGPGRRRTDFMKAAEEGEMTQEQFLFIAAVEAFKRTNGKMFPTWTDVLEVVRLLGYRKTMASELNLRNVEDWTEKADTPSGVRSKPGHPEMGRRAA